MRRQFPWIFLLLFLAAQMVFANDINTFLNNVEKRANELENNHPYTVKVKSVQSEMDGKWKPKKVTTTHKVVTKVDSLETTEIISSTIEEKGKVKDNTAEAIKEENSEKGRKMKIGGKDFFPFNSENRNKFSFQVKTDSLFEGTSVTVLECVAGEAKQGLFNGSYYFDVDDLTLLGLVARPSKNPKMVKDMLLKMSFGINENDVYNIKSFEMKVHVKVLIKNMRMHVFETYEKYEYLD
jgi:hypothetical protein